MSRNSIMSLIMSLNQCERDAEQIQRRLSELKAKLGILSASRDVRDAQGAREAGVCARVKINNTTVNNNTSFNINKQVKRGEYEGGGIMGDTPQPPACVETKKVTRFVKPTEDEVRDFCREKGYTKVNAADFIDYYESNGWMVGKNKMKDWKRTVSRWERMDQQGRGGNCAAGQAGNNGMPVGMILHTKKDVKASDYE